MGFKISIQKGKRKEKKGSNPSSSSIACNLGVFGCINQTPTFDFPSVAVSPTSDLNSPQFTHVLFRDFIEKNEF